MSVDRDTAGPEQRKIRRKRKSKEVAASEVRLSFADELGEDEAEAASPRASLGALTAGRFEAEAKALRKRSSSSSQRLLQEAALSGVSAPPLALRPAAAAAAAAAGGDHAPWPADRQPLLIHAVAQAKGGRPYMEDRHVWVQDLGTLAPRLQGVAYACVLDGHGGSRAADFAAAELHKRLAADEGLRLDAAGTVAACFKRVFSTTDRDFLATAASEQVSCVPFTASCTLCPRDRFVLIASDGVWDVRQRRQSAPLGSAPARLLRLVRAPWQCASSAPAPSQAPWQCASSAPAPR